MMSRKNLELAFLGDAVSTNGASQFPQRRVAILPDVNSCL